MTAPDPDRVRAASVSERAEHLLDPGPPDDLDREWLQETEAHHDLLAALADQLSALDPAARFLAEHLIRCNTGVVSLRDLHRGVSRQRFPRVDDLIDALNELTAAGWLTLLPPNRVRGRPGRPPGPTVIPHPPHPPHPRRAS